jgi:hypothetical protein
MAEEQQKDSIAGYARFCSVFAIFGIVFLGIIGYLFQAQPLYIKGPEDKQAAAHGCYQGAALYFVVWIFSIAYCRYDDAKQARAAASTPTSHDRPYGSISTRED